MGAHLLFVDESGFLLIPRVRRTWAPVDQTRLLRHWQRHDRLSVISGLSVSPRRQRLGLYFSLQDNNLHAANPCAFLRTPPAPYPGQVMVRWDGGKIHKGPLVRALCGGFPRLYRERFPPNAPELNLDEGLWTLAQGGLANGRPADRGVPRAQLLGAPLGTRQFPRRLRGCITQSDLPPLMR